MPDLASGRSFLATALVVAAVAQVLLTLGGALFPDRSGLYGAPFPVGQSSGLNFLFGGGAEFFFPLWLLNYVLTGALVLMLAVFLHGRIVWGLLAVAASPLVLFGFVGVLRINEGRINQLLVWTVMMLVMAAAWGVQRAALKI